MITVIDSRGKETRYPLDKIKMREDIRIGRCPVNEIPLDKEDRTASRHHARVIFENNEYFIEDICSAGGTFVNGKKIGRKRKLEDEDEIKIGKALMQFRSRGMEEKAYGAFVEV
jgi:pSer/pThr/pTyr-binding forkhead associated (FHA) protein